VRSVPVRDGAGEILYAINFFREVTAEHHEAARRGFLLRAADELNSSLDYERTLAAIAALAVPALADWCAVDLVDGGSIKRVATAHVDPAKVSAVTELQRRYPGDGTADMIRTGQPRMIAEISREMLVAAAHDAEHLRLMDELQLSSYLGVPLVLRGEATGAISFAMAESGRRYTEADLEFARALADRAAIAIENARLFEGEKQRREQAEETSRFAETFIGILGHDLRNPLNAIAMAAGLLRRQHGESKVVARIESSAQRMASMVDQLLDLTRSRLAGGIAIERQATDLGAIVGAAIDELALVYRGRAIEWTRRSLVGDWDHDRLAQVVSNLLGNALEHGDPERPVEIELDEGDADQAILVVRNQGAPIPAELLPVLFEPYRRGVRRAGTRGLGLGLFISDKIVQAHGGHIEVRSTADAGTELRVTLPGRLDAPRLREAAR
jgi:signal transduction histidine kinase